MHLIISANSGLLRVWKLWRSPICRHIYSTIRWICQFPAAAICRNSDDNFVFWHTRSNPIQSRIIQIQRRSYWRVIRSSIQRGIQAGNRFPYPMIVVGHQIDEINISCDVWNIVAGLNFVHTYWHS